MKNAFNSPSVEARVTVQVMAAVIMRTAFQTLISAEYLKSVGNMELAAAEEEQVEVVGAVIRVAVIPAVVAEEVAVVEMERLHPVMADP